MWIKRKNMRSVSLCTIELLLSEKLQLSYYPTNTLAHWAYISLIIILTAIKSLFQFTF
jgi:hypothetical protein